jgi:uncharacterized alkaline shock family protein YloU
MTDFSGDNLGAPNGLPTTKSPPPFPPRAEDRPTIGRETAPAAPSSLPSSGNVGPGSGGGPTLASNAVTPSPSGTVGGQGPGSVPGAGAASVGQANGGQRPSGEVRGRIEVADEVVEKVAALAATEVEGVADLGGDIERAIESVRERIGIGHKRGDQGVRAKINGREVSVDVTIMIMYGHVVMDVARAVKNNVAHQTNRMLGLNVVEVNVTVDDVKMPEPPKPATADNDGYDQG